jgi:4-hydroxythreonine-4-phosphate dehydrogenase
MPTHAAPIPRIAVSLGDPRGIGPEVVGKALAEADFLASATWVLVGARTNAEMLLVEHPHLCAHCEIDAVESPLRPSDREAWAGDISFRAVDRAIALVQQGGCAALVTAPINKAAWAAAGHPRWPGHTELLAERFGSPDAAMMFHAPPDAHAQAGGRCGAGLQVILASVHLPLSRVPAALSTQRIVRVAQLGAQQMQLLGVPRPRIALAGLNPHAGEGGLLGTEDDAIIAPASAALRAAGLDCQGPLPADTLFAQALHWPGTAGPSHFDLVVAMYHDQGLAPLKMIAWDRAVNMTVGLRWRGKSVVRTSPDHGTALDIAGRGIAHPGSMRAALAVALRSSTNTR